MARKLGVRSSELYIRLQKGFDSTNRVRLPAKNSFEMPTRRESDMDIKLYKSMPAKKCKECPEFCVDVISPLHCLEERGSGALNQTRGFNLRSH